MKILNDQPSELLFQTLKQIRQASNVEKIYKILVDFSQRLSFDRIIICSISPNHRSEIIEEIFSYMAIGLIAPILKNAINTYGIVPLHVIFLIMMSLSSGPKLTIKIV
ncbi:hypothetical protein PYR77_09415 [Acinetobacter soli]|nr:hypothetical protein [Acinetobacter soli]WEH91126.1 hypothetical protein PYR75_09850 [Acinetobacter soli]WEH97452.1 hypothetical protein PYR76_14240 [Acinetobacter soli]WEH99633.1 hypothetical protein PYR77_09415 [Acinetobacter soli]WEI12229.1 hypothetical protein PX667_12610 [Acinetobacter soli]WEI16243.1 hypothetical protein PX668_05420 [Acinetobacter soli]